MSFDGTLDSEGSSQFSNESNEERDNTHTHTPSSNVVANQNAAFRRFLQELDGKDAKTKIEEAAVGMDYFMRPEVSIWVCLSVCVYRCHSGHILLEVSFLCIHIYTHNVYRR